ncbi:glycosyltransferase [Ancylobacter radicis]|uniref:Glycosyltransferase n=1 Tax=Ancylobacter radicis TaxID=2836179 RepID=A0ABS5R9J6_9HYPH|nr:glycosyltransferase [Ancylobacter radicis]MBS9478341.1 glycosyltransferase [Ancylobacter radicis]
MEWHLTMASDSPIFVSIVVPVYSGESYLRSLTSQLDAIRADWRQRGLPVDLAEVILVDDSAIDGSPTIVDALAGEYDFVTALHLMRNFGQHPATIAGILHSSGDWVVTMDEDLQHSPSDIERLLRRAILTSADIVYALPSRGVHQTRLRDWGSRGFKKLMVLLTGNTNIQRFNSFRLLRGSLARAASSVCGHETYFDVALSWFTRRVETVKVDLKDHRFIETGRSGYNFWRLLTHARRLLISSQVKIVRLFGLIAVATVLVSIIGSLWLLIERVFFPSPTLAAGWTSLMLVLLFFGGLVTFMISLVLEYLSIIVLATHGKPIFFAVDRSIDRPLAAYFATESR